MPFLSLLSLLSLLLLLSQMSLLSLLSHRQVGSQVLITFHYTKGHFFTKVDRLTDGPTDGRTNGPTTRLQELLRAAKNGLSKILNLLILLVDHTQSSEKNHPQNSSANICHHTMKYPSSLHYTVDHFSPIPPRQQCMSGC